MRNSNLCNRIATLNASMCGPPSALDVFARVQSQVFQIYIIDLMSRGESERETWGKLQAVTARMGCLSEQPSALAGTKTDREELHRLPNKSSFTQYLQVNRGEIKRGCPTFSRPLVAFQGKTRRVYLPPSQNSDFGLIFVVFCIIFNC